MNFIQNNGSGDVHHIHRNVSRVLLDITLTHYTQLPKIRIVYIMLLLFYENFTKILILGYITDILSTGNIDIQTTNYSFQSSRYSKKRIGYARNADTQTSQKCP